MQQYQQSQAKLMQQYQQKQLEAHQQGFQKLNEQVANKQIGIQTELGHFKEELNPNLVDMPVTKLVRLIYDNCDKKRPAFLGCLKSDHEAGSSSQAAPPATPTAVPTSAATATTIPTPAPAPQHDQDDYYPEQFFQK
ncbi:hypothetical protein PIB30_020110 [Stylosanthes scabra]|uniref:Uncharacterized protein n=1 Tax=Stylosanthes scabra TaxID=79078 RepID=A0ABU6X8I9_9FABA|nr:hypothetical protein [Stylosanthes scabra]